MADNLTQSGSGTVATEEWPAGGGVHYQLFAVAHPENAWAANGTPVGTTVVTLQAAPGSGTSLWLTYLQAINQGTVGATVTVSGGTQLVGALYNSGDGWVSPLGLPGWRLGDATALTVALGAAGSVTVFASGYRGA